jgi:uncharacterized protein DUF4190
MHAARCCRAWPVVRYLAASAVTLASLAMFIGAYRVNLNSESETQVYRGRYTFEDPDSQQQAGGLLSVGVVLGALAAFLWDPRLLKRWGTEQPRQSAEPQKRPDTGAQAEQRCRQCGICVLFRRSEGTLACICGYQSALEKFERTSAKPRRRSWASLVDGFVTGPSPDLSGYAIAAGYAGLFSLLILPAPLALGLGIAALRDIRRNGKRGRGRTWFALVLGSLGTVAVLGILFFSLLR